MTLLNPSLIREAIEAASSDDCSDTTDFMKAHGITPSLALREAALAYLALIPQQLDVDKGLLNTLNKAEFDLGVAKSNLRLLKELCDQKDERIAELLGALKMAKTIIGHPDDEFSKYISELIARAEQKAEKL